MPATTSPVGAKAASRQRHETRRFAQSGTVKFSAATALPYEHLQRATAGLLAELRQQLLHAGVHEMPLWDTLEVTGRHELTDMRGRRWFEYRATVTARRPFDATTH